jgi:hypothetical protein
MLRCALFTVLISASKEVVEKVVRHTGESRCPGININAFIDILDSGFRRNDGI